jgi:hypothetical protein
LKELLYTPGRDRLLADNKTPHENTAEFSHFAVTLAERQLGLVYTVNLMVNPGRLDACLVVGSRPGVQLYI